MKKVISLILFCALPVFAYSQLVPVTDQYLFNAMTINPACAGGRSALSMSMLYRYQWTGLVGSPQTGVFSVDAPLLNERIGLGLMVVADRIGVTKEEQIMSNYAYRVRLGGGILSMGLGANLIITNSSWSDLVTNDDIGDAPFLVDSRTYLMPNFRFGLYYSYKNYYAGFSVPRFLDATFDFEKNKYVLHSNTQYYNYLFNTGYTFNINKRISLMPSLLLGFMSSEGFTFDINLKAGYINKFWGGLSYRSNNTLSALFQMQINDQFGIGYSYYYDLGKIGRYSNGSHQIMLRYEFKYKVNVNNPLLN